MSRFSRRPNRRAAAPAGNVEAGKRLYDKHTCYFCHGTAGQGGVAGARVAARPAQRAELHPVCAAAARIDAGILGKDAVGSGIADILAYLRSLPPAKPVSDIPLLNQLRGK